MAKSNENTMDLSHVAPYVIGGVTFDPTETDFPPETNAGLWRQGLTRIVGVYVNAKVRDGEKEQDAARDVLAALSDGSYKFGGGGPRRDPFTVHLHDYVTALILKIAKGSKSVDVSKAVKADAEAALRVQCEENGKDFAKFWAKANKIAKQRAADDAEDDEHMEDDVPTDVSSVAKKAA